jgi:hypothetical protein
MPKAIFEGLVFDDYDRPLSVAYIGAEPTYVLMEDGFKYHVDARKVDDQIMAAFRDQIKGNEDMIVDGMMKMIGKDDLFTKVAVNSAIKNVDKNLDQLREAGIPEQARQYLGMMGFRVRIDRSGTVLSINMPGAADTNE